MASDDKKEELQEHDSPEKQPALHGTVPCGQEDFEAEAEFQAKMAGLERQKPAEKKPQQDERK